MAVPCGLLFSFACSWSHGNLDELLFQDPTSFKHPTSTPESHDSTTLLIRHLVPALFVVTRVATCRRTHKPSVLSEAEQSSNCLLMRRTSVSLPTTRNVAYDTHEKPARYNPRLASHRNNSIFGRIRTAWMTQSQRSRYFKTGGILLFVVFLFYFFSSRGGDVYNEGEC